MMIIYKLIISLFLLSLCGVSAFAYNINRCDGKKVKWESNTIRIRASAVSFPTGHGFTNALTTAVNRWNDNPSRFNFNLTYNDSSVGFDNGQNEIWFSNDAVDLDNNPAVTWVWTDCEEIIEADVLFDINEPWTISTVKAMIWSYGGANRPFQTTAIHELGHALGLDHTSDRYSIMGQDWDHIHTNNNSTYAYPGEDASSGAVYLYGTDSSAGEDVGVVHWRRIGQNGEYSTHDRTRIFDKNDNEKISFLVGGEPVYRVYSGEEIRSEFTYENNGLHGQTIDVEFYLSTNDNITQWDTAIADTSITVNRGAPDTLRHTFTLPRNLTVGNTYYIGAVVDDSGSVNEFSETNNATYTGIRIISPILESLSFDPVYATGSSTGEVFLSGDAPPGGVTVFLSSSRSTVSVPASVVIPQGEISETFTAGFIPGIHYYNDAVNGYISTDITATAGANTVTSRFYLAVIPESPPAIEGVALCDSTYGLPEPLARLCHILELLAEREETYCRHDDCFFDEVRDSDPRRRAGAKHVKSLIKEIHALIVSAGKKKIDDNQLKQIAALLKRSPSGKYYNEPRRESLLKDLPPPSEFTDESFDLLIKAVNAMQLDLGVPEISKVNVDVGSEIKANLENVAWVNFSKVSKAGQVGLRIAEGKASYFRGYKPGWPLAVYEFDFTGSIPEKEHIDLSIYVGGLGFLGELSDLCIFEFDGVKYRDITTKVDVKNRIISGRTEQLSKYVILSKDVKR